jgi:hypothetical protein
MKLTSETPIYIIEKFRKQSHYKKQEQEQEQKTKIKQKIIFKVR